MDVLHIISKLGVTEGKTPAKVLVMKRPDKTPPFRLDCLGWRSRVAESVKGGC